MGGGKMSSLLINEPPLQVLPSLAVKIGLAEAIVVQQIHYWLQRTKPMDDGLRWVYNSLAEWEKQFPFWHRNTIANHLKSLRQSGILVAEFKAPKATDRTLYYRIDYDKLGGMTTQNLCNELLKNCDIPINTETTKDYFSDFWKLYPKRLAKEDARKAFKKLKMTDELFQQIAKAIKDQGLATGDLKFVPYPATWLNGKRWEDEIKVANTTAFPFGRRIL